MNEKIKELAKQARRYAWDNETHWSANAEREALFEEKFAELIAKQCIEICKIERSNVNTRRRQAQDEIEYIKCIEAGSTCDIINMEIWKVFIK